MVRPMPIYTPDNIINPIPLAIGLFVSITILVSLCAKHHHAKKVPRKSAPKGTSNSDTEVMHKIEIPSPKAIPLPKKSGNGSPESDAGDKGLHEERFGEVGLWQKAILMGDKCRPPQFSGVIYYDYSGNRIPEMPRSPKAGPLVNYLAEKNGDSI